MNKQRKILSRNVIVNGENCGLCIVTIGEDGEICSYKPFVTEEAGVEFIDDAIIINRMPDGSTPSFKIEFKAGFKDRSILEN